MSHGPTAPTMGSILDLLHCWRPSGLPGGVAPPRVAIREDLGAKGSGQAAGVASLSAARGGGVGGDVTP